MQSPSIIIYFAIFCKEIVENFNVIAAFVTSFIRRREEEILCIHLRKMHSLHSFTEINFSAYKNFLVV